MDGQVFRTIWNFSTASLFTLVLGSSTVLAEDLSAPLTFVAIGDSLTTGFNAQRLLDNFPYSWSTGTTSTSAFASQASRVEQVAGRTVQRLNFAVAGSRALDLARQAEQIQDKKPDFATVLIGANDVCSWPEDHHEALGLFDRDLRAGIEGLIAKNPAVRIALVPVPDMGNLYELGSTHGCQAIWNITSFCNALLGSERTPAERQSFLNRLADLNFQVATIAASYRNNVRFEAALGDVQFEWQDISRIDCFHPSVSGQGKLSQKLWETSWVQ